MDIDGYKELACRKDVSVRPALSRAELARAYNLVDRRYTKEGLLPGDDYDAQYCHSYEETSPGQVTFVAIVDDTLVATASVMPDSQHGLSMDDPYRAELDALRARGRTLSEVTMLATADQTPEGGLQMLLLLFKRLFDYAWFVLEANDVCVAVHPRHAPFYENFLQFEPLGPRRPYSSVQNKPAVAKRLDLCRAKKRYRKSQQLWTIFFRNRTPVSLLRSGYQRKLQRAMPPSPSKSSARQKGVSFGEPIFCARDPGWMMS